MKQYIVARFLTDGTFYVEFFPTRKRAEERAKELRKISKIIIEKVSIYEEIKA